MQLDINMRLLAQSHFMTQIDHAHATEFGAWQLKLGDGTANHDATMITLPAGIIFSFIADF
jgi:hypothetical protein